MNKYEMTVVINGKLEEEAKNEVLERAKALIERFGGTIKNVDEWGKKKFAYEIQKTKEGYYNFIKFEAESSAPAEIENRMRIMDGVVRYLIVIDDLPENAQIKKEEPPVETSEEAPAPKEDAKEAETEEPEAPASEDNAEAEATEDSGETE